MASSLQKPDKGGQIYELKVSTRRGALQNLESFARCFTDMTDASLMEACHRFFSDHDLVAATSKSLLFEVGGPKGADQARMAEVRAAIDLLHDCMISGTGVGNRGRLANAEEICLRELQRPSGSPNGPGQHAHARFVLAAINHMRGEPEVCAANIAHAFVIEPRWCRDAFPNVFQASFRPFCSSLYIRLEREEATVRAKSYLASMIARRVAAVGVGVGILGMMIFFGVKGGAGNIVSNAVKPIWQSGAPENSRKVRLARLRQRFEEHLDQKCRSIALHVL